MNGVRASLALLLLLVLAGCGAFSSDEEIEPAALESFNQELELDELWSVQIGDGLGEKYHQLTPAVLSTRIYAVDYEGRVYAIERDSGDKVWQQELELDVSGGVGVGEGRVVITSYNGQVVALSALDGSQAWTAELSSEAVAPAALSAGVAVIQTIDGRLTAFDSQTGELRWSYSAQEPSLTLRGTSAPLISSGTVYAGFASGRVAAFDLQNGDQKWDARVAESQGRTELERMSDVDGTLLADRGVLYVTSYQGRLVAMVMRDGRRLWRQPLSSYQSVTSNDQLLFGVDDQGSVVAFDRTTGEQKWKQEALFYRQVSAPAMLGGWVAVADFEGYLHLLSPDDGRFVGRYRVDSSAILAPPIGTEGLLYTLSNDGELTALQIDKR